MSNVVNDVLAYCDECNLCFDGLGWSEYKTIREYGRLLCDECKKREDERRVEE